MLLYKDIVTGKDEDELFTDAFPMKEVDDIVYEVDCAMIVVKDGEVDIGANPSAEEQEEALEDGAVQVNNLVHSSGLVQTSFDKKSYTSHLKAYMQAVKAKLQESNPDRVAAFQKGAQAYAKKILGNFDNYDFYIGKSMSVEPPGMIALLNYREDGITPYFTFWKDGLKEQKL
ncbi:hypothetical protein FRC00_010516 [Tulasnella sp. 408]|nr:hypothetical protein FRC00_010516 [Tulasnella sp. 408]